MLTRREVLALLGSTAATTWMAKGGGQFGNLAQPFQALTASTKQTPPLAPGAPNSPERLSLIETFKRASDGLEKQFEPHVHKSDWQMPYRLFRPQGAAKLPLVVFLHGSGGMGTDNMKHMGLGNVFGTRVWALPENQKKFPCYVLAPQTDRGWMRYGPPAAGDSVAQLEAGLGEGARLTFEIIDALQKELPIDESRIYIAGQSLGGGGVWHMTAQRPQFFAAAVTCCGSASKDNPTDSARTPVWNFHGDADQTVPIAVSRTRIAALTKAGAHPLHTEYPGVAHNAWEWAFTEPEVVKWMFAQRKA